METEMKTKSKIIAYIIHSIAVLVLTAQISLAGSATWLLSPQDSAWENANNWTLGGPPNGPSDIATFAQSSQRYPSISTSVELNSIVFTSNSDSFSLSIPPLFSYPPRTAQLIISGTGISNNNSVLQTFLAWEGGQIIFNNSATAGSAQMRIVNYDVLFPDNSTGGETIFNDTSSAAGASIANGGSIYGAPSGQTIFNDTSTADHASISNGGAGASSNPGNPGQTTFNGTSTAANASIDNHISEGGGNGGYTVFSDTSTAGHATITNEGGDNGVTRTPGGRTVFNDSSTADSAILVANGTINRDGGGAILFRGASTGGTARVKVFDNGYLDISGRRPGVNIGSIEGSGNVYLGANRLTVGTNGIDTSFSGVISGSGLLSKIGSGVLTLQTNDCIADTVGLILVSGSVIKLDFTGPPDVIASLKVNGVPQPPGIYGGPMSGAPNVLPEFAGSGTVSVGPVATLGNISTRAFVQTDDNVMIGGFIVQGTEPKTVIIRAIGPELTRYGVPDVLVNPTLELHDGTGALIASNDSWLHTIIGGIITNNQVRDIRNSGYAPGDARESAIIADLPAGNYTAIVRGVNDTTGVALVDVYDLTPDANSILGNLSTRSFVQTGDDVMIGGFIVQGAQPKRLIVRAIGPELTQYGVPNAMVNPTLELYDANGALIASNDNWRTTIIGGIITSDQVRDIRNSGHAPGDGRESAIIADLPAGNYTAIVRGVNNTTGVSLVEVYDLDQ
jgi:hypothetical protein